MHRTFGLMVRSTIVSNLFYGSTALYMYRDDKPRSAYCHIPYVTYHVYSDH